MTRKATPGDFGLCAVVWPTPRTMTAPVICYQQPRCRVLRISWPYVTVRIAPERNASDNAPTYRLHVDNLRRTTPDASRSATRTRPAPPGQLPLF